MPSSFGCSPGTYGDRLWTTELQKRLMICDPTADLITVEYAKPWRKARSPPGVDPRRRSAPGSDLRISLWMSAQGSIASFRARCHLDRLTPMNGRAPP